MADSTLADLTAATPATGGLFYGTQSGADRKFLLSATGASVIEAASKTAAKEALDLAAMQPIIVAFKNINVLTSGAPADIASVTLPSWCTRYTVVTTGSRMLAESAAGSLNTSAFIVRDAASGAGNALTASAAGPSSTAVTVSITGASAAIPPVTATTLYLNQTANSGNAGVISVYLMIIPFL